MPPYVPNVPAWTDETGVGDGTLFTAARMNHIEDGVEELSDEIASLSGGGGILDGGILPLIMRVYLLLIVVELHERYPI